MGRFRYVAYDSTGNRISSATTADSVDQIKESLWSQGLHIVDISARTFQLPPLAELFPTFIKVRRGEVILFTKELATFARVGIPMLDGLAVLREQASSDLMKRAIADIIKDIRSGSPLSTALAKHPRVFGRLYVDMVRSAEVSGNLDDVLRQLSLYMTRDESALRKVRNAMIYPAIVVVLALGVISVLVGFVLPAFARLFADFRATMPLPTRILLSIGLFCRDHSVTILSVLLLVSVAIVLYTRTRRGRETLDEVLLRIPNLGVIFRYAIVERYLRTLATLARAGVPITQMIDTANHSLGNTVFERGLRDARGRMLSGEGFARPLERTGLFPKLVIQMVRVGEETGHLDTNLEEAAEHYAEEVDYRLKQLIAVLEPALVIVVGVMVGFIAISVIAPMYSLVHAVR
jgi:type IV pilus assembly protein PilC